MLEAEFPVQTFAEIKNGMTSKSENMSATYTEGQFSLSVDGKVFSSKDPCAVIMSGTKTMYSNALRIKLVRSNNLFRLILADGEGIGADSP